MTNLIATDLQKQEIDSPLINLFEVELPSSSKIYLHSGVDDTLQNVRFRDFDDNSVIRTYTAFPILVDGMEQSSDGALNRPTLTIANIGTGFKQLLSGYTNKDLIGQRITRRQTLEKYLFGQSPDLSNPPVELSRITYTIDRISRETSVAVTFELSAVHDLEGIQLPRRTLVGKYCSWIYQGNELYNKGGCTWQGAVVDRSMVREGDLGQDDQNDLRTGIYFDVNNNHMALEDLLEAQSYAWNNQASYNVNTHVSHLSKYYVSKSATGNTNKVPGSASGADFWQEVRAYRVWSSGNISYSTGDLVRHVITVNGVNFETIFIALQDHTSGVANEPSSSSPVWQREELCSKTLEGCKCRFGAKLRATYTNPINEEEDYLVQYTKHKGMTLPFGSFPGATKFR